MNAGHLGYRRKRGGTELRRAAFDGLMPLEMYQELHAMRRRRTRANGQDVAARAYPLWGRAAAAGKVTWMSKQRMRCRNAQHAGMRVAVGLCGGAQARVRDVADEGDDPPRT